MQMSLVLRARDETQAAMRSALGGLASFTRAAGRGVTVPLRLGTASLGLLRDIHLGLRPALGALDALIERGTRLKLVERAFGGLAGVGGEAAERLARRLQVASGSTLRLAEAMRMANRGLSLGLDLRTIVTATEFAARKAATLGEAPEALLERILLDLGKGTTRVLDDIGLMRDGVEGVAAAYDRIHGARAFAGLSESAQKMEIARAAVAEMRRDMSGMRVTLGDVANGWTRIRTTVGDAMDRLMATVASSPAMREFMDGFSAVVNRVQTHFRGGGTFGELLRGRDGGGGLLGVARGALGDLGAAIGRGAATAFDWLRDLVPAAIERLRVWRDELIARLAAVLEPLVTAIGRLSEFAARMFAALPGPVRAAASGAWSGAKSWATDPGGSARALWIGMRAFPRAIIESMRPGGVMNEPLRDMADWIAGPLLRLIQRGSRRPGDPSASAAGMGWMPGVGTVPIGAMVGSAALGQSATAAALGQSAFGDRIAAFAREFPLSTDARSVAAGEAELRELEIRRQLQGRLAMTPGARINAIARQRRLQDQRRNLLEGHSTAGLALRREAAAAAGEKARLARQQGRLVTAADRQSFFDEELRTRLAAARSQFDQQIESGHQELLLDNRLRRAGGAAAAPTEQAISNAVPLVREVLTTQRQLTQQIAALVAVLGGEERAIARAV